MVFRVIIREFPTSRFSFSNFTKSLHDTIFQTAHTSTYTLSVPFLYYILFHSFNWASLIWVKLTETVCCSLDRKCLLFRFSVLPYVMNSGIWHYENYRNLLTLYWRPFAFDAALTLQSLSSFFIFIVNVLPEFFGRWLGNASLAGNWRKYFLHPHSHSYEVNLYLWLCTSTLFESWWVHFRSGGETKVSINPIIENDFVYHCSEFLIS